MLIKLESIFTLIAIECIDIHLIKQLIVLIRIEFDMIEIDK